MLLSINKNICIYQKYDKLELTYEKASIDSSDDAEKFLAIQGYQDLYISIKNNWFRTIPMEELYLSRNKEDGYY